MTAAARRFFEWLFERALSPFERFLRRTTAGGIVLLATTLLALILSSMLGADAVGGFWSQELALSFGAHEMSLSLTHWVNDGLMAVFFLLVGLELKREILVGELSTPKDAALPVLAAIGGMVLPALVFLAFNAGTAGARGWGIPMATDIAFAVGILVLLAWRVPRNAILFLTALAIADDLGAVLVIALFYTAELRMGAVAIAAALCAGLAALNLGGIRRPLPYVLVAVALWFFVHESGLHATIAGILTAAAIPARGSECPLERWEHRLTPWVTFVIIPIFALCNAGIDLTAVRWGEAATARLTAGIAVGLVAGKFVGIAGASWLAVTLGLARLPRDVRWAHLLGTAWLGGIGFTMSLFIAQLAFTDAASLDLAKVGILCGSALAAAIGLVWLYVAGAER